MCVSEKSVFTQMAVQLVNCGIYIDKRSITLLPWTIMRVPEPEFIFRVFSMEEVLPRIEKQDGLLLQSSHAGRSKETFDKVDLDLSVQAVVAGFGPFVKYRTTLSLTSSLPSVVVGNNALALLMSSVRSMAAPGLPTLRMECTSKDRLYNDLLKLLDEHNLKFSSDARTSGEKLVHAFKEALLYIDGHHHLLSE